MNIHLDAALRHRPLLRGRLLCLFKAPARLSNDPLTRRLCHARRYIWHLRITNLDRLRRQVPTVTRERPRSPDIQASLKDSRPHARQQVHEHQRFSKKFTSRILRQSRRDREFRKRSEERRVGKEDKEEEATEEETK